MSQPVITSRQNSRIKQACALRNRSSRYQTQTTLVYGVRESQRALAAGALARCVFWCPAYFRSPAAEPVVRELAQGGAESFEVSVEVFDKLAYGDRLDGVVTIFETRTQGLSNLKLSEQPLVAVIEGVEKPGNLGAILRSADGAGMDAVLVVDPVIDLFNPNTIRASVASVFQSNIALATASEALTWLGEQGMQVFAALPEGHKPYFEADYTGACAIVLGSEAQGLNEVWRRSNFTGVAIPMRGCADSLNVSTSAAVLFYEAQRQRTISGQVGE